jgi:short subunit dehydrogenase-like uncharacterized protein
VVQGLSAGGAAMMKLPRAEALWEAAVRKLGKGSTGGPDAETRARSTSHIVGIAYDAGGRQLSEVHVSGIDPYTFTGRILAWGAERAAAGALQGTGALGPVDAFGLDELRRGCSEAGMAEEGHNSPSPNGTSAGHPAAAQG